MAMSNPFERKKISWHRAVLQAIAVNAAIIAALLGVYTSSTGADNPLAFYIALILQFPSSLLLSRIISVWKALGSSDLASMLGAEAVVALLQLGLLTVIFKRPWAD